MRKNLLFFIVVCLILNWHTGFGQDREVSGKVTDAEDGSGLPGVNVLLQGTKSGAVTDMDGNYKITIPEGATLVFSYIGYETKVIAVGAQAIINVEMFFDVKQLSEIVVTAQGIEKSARSLGYSATEVNAEEITKGRTTDVMSSLQGKVAGATITTASGAPGASTKVIVRGYSSIGSNNNPLYIVDGVPINNSSNAFNQSDLATDVNRSQDFGNRANDVNPDDVESITILKGASATALYGSRAANGVIIITTKKGKANSGVNIGFTSSATISEPLRLPQLQNKFGQGWSGHFAYEENGSWGPIMDGKERLWGNVVNNSQQLKTFEPRENLKDFYEIGNSFINTISLHGGSDLTTYYLSYGNVQGNGVTPGDADVLDRNTLSLRGTLSGNKVSARASLNYSHKEQSVITVGQGGAGTTTFQELIQIPRDHSIVDMKDYNDPFNNLDNFYTLYAQNPYWSINENGNKFGEDRVYGNVNVSYDFTDWLSASYRLGADVANSQVKDWIAVAEITPGAPNYGTQPIPGQVTEYSRYARELDHTFMVNSSRDITERFAITGLIGLNNNERYFRNLSIRVDDLDIPGFYDISNSSGTPVTTSFESLRRLIGLYGQFEASYNDYLYLTLLARNDWSSTLPKDNNTFFYPGANLSFVFSELVPGIENILTEGK
ncbi:MAG: SusC/RagA family TonB-linked outer membrane protein, partial [Cyclobacteriaceae bacterium]|nr:SusC/RagA family TonB-linked outer membrane protein [Cyclobacteriaceae bacterium]